MPSQPTSARTCPHLPNLFTPTHACYLPCWHHFLSSNLTGLGFPIAFKALVLTSFAAFSQDEASFGEASPSSPDWVGCPGHMPTVPSSSLWGPHSSDAWWAVARRG